MSRPVRVGITHGDINGISYEVIMKALEDERMPELCTPVIFGSAKLVGYYRKTLGMDDFPVHQVFDASEAREGAVNLVNITDAELKVDMGRPTPESGQAALLSLEKAVEALRAGDIDVLVTAPINKSCIQGDGFHFPGHTEYLQERLGGEGDRALMVLFAGSLRVALVTTHLPIAAVPEAITREAVAGTVRRFESVLRQDFAIERPRIAVLSLNPHCGDDGLLGGEEKESITPAIDECVAEGMTVFGPYAADGFFATGAWRKFDGVVAMYHDQGLAPFKTVARENGVNYTAGLPYVRTSPDHGTGYDIAGKGVADAASMRQAIYEAVDIWRNRRIWQRISAHPLRKQYEARGADKTVDLTKEEA